MARRKATDVVQVPIRMRESLRAQVEKAAKARKVSLNAEAVRRLDQSFAEEEALGGPDLAEIANLMMAAFRLGGRRGAEACQHPEWTPAEWSRNPFCFEAAMVAVMDALLNAAPKPEGRNELLDKAERIFAAFAARGYDVKRIQGSSKKDDEQ